MGTKQHLVWVDINKFLLHWIHSYFELCSGSHFVFSLGGETFFFPFILCDKTPLSPKQSIPAKMVAWQLASRFKEAITIDTISHW